MGHTSHDGLAIPGRVDLAHEPDFQLGGTSVSPSTRELINGTQRETIEPRMMQVLVALARAKGQVVTRDELIQLCWNGRAVGDDSVNRILWRLRQIFQRLDKSVQLETIARVGYRLTHAGTASARSPIPEAQEFKGHYGRVSRRTVVAGAAAGVGLTVAGMVAWSGTGVEHQPDPRAKRYFDRGIQLRGQAVIEQTQQSIAYFREATRIDPEYSDAWGALAWGQRSLLDYGDREDAAEVKLLARTAANRALDLDPSNADATVALLLIDPMFGRWAEVEAGCRQILARHPAHSITEFNLATVLAETGRWVESLPPTRRVAERETFWPLARWRLCDALVCAGHFEEAGREFETAFRLWPGRFDLWALKINYLLVSDRGAEAISLAEDPEQRPAANDASINQVREVVRAVVTKLPEHRQRALANIKSFARQGPVQLGTAAAKAALLSSPDLAFDMWDALYFNRGPWRRGVIQRPFTSCLFKAETKPIRDDVRFRKLVREIGLEGYWRLTGNIPDYLRRAG